MALNIITVLLFQFPGVAEGFPFGLQLCDQLPAFFFLLMGKDSSWGIADCWLYSVLITLQKSCGFVLTLIGCKKKHFCQYLPSSAGCTDLAVNTFDQAFHAGVRVKFLEWCVWLGALVEVV